MEGWPVVGRVAELERLDRLVVRERRGAILGGPAGMGKTTLALACLRHAEQRGMAIARTTATRASSGLPFGALAPVLPADTSAGGPDERIAEDPAALLRRYAEALVQQAGGRPLVVFVDDAHLLDDASATLLLQLAQTHAAAVLASVRSGEPAPDPVITLWKDDLLERIDVHALDRQSIDDLLGSVLGGPVSPGTEDQLARRCAGNPLVLRELVLGALDTGALTNDGGMWHVRGRLRPSARLTELVEQRLAGLTETERAMLELVAVREPLGLAELMELADPEAMDALERKGLVTSRTDGRRLELWLGHPVYGDVLLAGVTARRARTIARSRAEVIERAGARRREDVLQIASWRLLGGEGSPELLLAGARAARRRHDYPLTEQLGQAAVAAGAGFEAKFLSAEAAYLLGRSDEAEEQLAVLAAAADGEAQRARVATTRFDNALYVRGNVALHLLDEVEAAITDRFWLDELLNRRLVAGYVTSGPRATVEAARPLLERPRTDQMSLGLIVAAFALTRTGRLQDALEVIGPGAADMVSAAGLRYPAIRLRSRALALVHLGRLDEAVAMLSAAVDQAVVSHATEAQAFLGGTLAIALLEQGRVVSAALRSREAINRCNELGRATLVREVYITNALAHALTGRAREAEVALAGVHALHLPYPDPTADLLNAEAWAAVAAGDVPAARRNLEAAAERGAALGDVLGEAAALHGLARLGRPQVGRERLATLATQSDGELVQARAAHTAALAEHDAVALEGAAHAFERMGAWLYAAEALADAGVMLRRAGNARAAAAAERRAGSAAARCEGAVTPALRGIGARARLAPAELDTARLAAAGRSNKEIAGELYLSIRTVENRLQRIYEKLGVTGRSELAGVLDAM